MMITLSPVEYGVVALYWRVCATEFTPMPFASELKGLRQGGLASSSVGRPRTLLSGHQSRAVTHALALG